MTNFPSRKCSTVIATSASASLRPFSDSGLVLQPAVSACRLLAHHIGARIQPIERDLALQQRNRAVHVDRQIEARPSCRPSDSLGILQGIDPVLGGNLRRQAKRRPGPNVSGAAAPAPCISWRKDGPDMLTMPELCVAPMTVPSKCRLSERRIHIEHQLGGLFLQIGLPDCRCGR